MAKKSIFLFLRTWRPLRLCESHPLFDLFLYLWIVFVYHEAHEDHEEFFNLIPLRALRGDISLSRCNLLFLSESALYRLSPFLRGRPPLGFI